MERVGRLRARSILGIGLALAVALSARVQVAQGQSAPAGFAPTLGHANSDNSYRQTRALIAEFDFESDPTGVHLWGDATIVTAPGLIIGGSRSVRLTGTNALVEIDSARLALEPGRIYALEYDYRVTEGEDLASAMVVMARWGADSGLHIDPWGMPAWVFGEAGTQSRQFLFGSDGFPTFLLATASPATVIVDNLRVWRLDSEAARSRATVFDFGFPRLGNYFYGSPYDCAWFNGGDAGEIEEVLARFDLVNGVEIDHTWGDTSWITRMRETNPSIVILPYRLSYSAQNIDHNDPVGGTAGMEALFNRAIAPEWIMRGPDGEPLVDQIFEGNTQLDPTPYCERVNGVVFQEFMELFIGNTVLPSGLWSGVHFDQSEWYPNPLLAETINGPLPPIDIDRDGVADSNPFIFGQMREAFEEYFARMRRRFGSSRVIYGNPGRIPLDSGVLAALSGWQQELLSPYEIEPDGDWNPLRSAQWHDFIRNYLAASRYTRPPQAINVQWTGRGLGVSTGTLTGHGYPNRVPQLESRDYQRMRLGLTTTLMGNGFFGYDFVDNTTPPVWFDEYAIDATGAPTTDLSGKGYLGQPIGVAQEIHRDAAVVLETGFESDPPPGLELGLGAVTTTVPWQVIEGDASLAVTRAGTEDFIIFETDPSVIPLAIGTTYDFQVRFRIVDYQPQAYDSLVVAGIGHDPSGIDFFGRSLVYNQDIEGLGQTITVRSQVTVTEPDTFVYAHMADYGIVSVDGLRIAELGGGAFRRDFEHGIALTNPTPEPITLTQAEIAGPLGRTGIRRIAGVQDPAVNSGLPVTDGITIPGADGIVLLADAIDAAPPPAPAYLAAIPDAVDAEADLYWEHAPNPSVAGGLIECKLAEGDVWDRFEFATPDGHHRLEFLHPGSTYDVRLAMFDFAGNYSSFSEITQVTTPGEAPVRAQIDSIDRMERGAFVTLYGEDLSWIGMDLGSELPYEFEGTTVTVNGVPARLSFVLPWSIVFAVPETVALGDAIVRVHREGIASAGFGATVFPVTVPSCDADANADGSTDAADFIVLAASFGNAVPNYTAGDVNGDGYVNAADFIKLAASYGCRTQ